MTDLHVIILAAGQGSRMRSTLPKVLHPVAHEALLSHVLRTAKAAGAASITGVVSPHMPEVAACFDGHNLAVQDQPQGTGDAVKAALAIMPADQLGIAVVLYADTPLVQVATIQALIQPILEDQAATTVFGMRLTDPAAYGRLVTDEADGSLIRIVEAREADEATLAIDLCNGGYMAFDLGRCRGLVDRIDNNNNKGEYYLTDLPELAREVGHKSLVVETDPEDAIGVNDRADLAVVEAIMQRRLRSRHLAAGVTLTAPETVFFAADTELAADTVVEPHVVFGPGVRVTGAATIRAFSHLEQAEIGDGAVIGPYARIRPGSQIGPKARVGNFVETKNVVMGEGAKANHLSYLGDATVGAGANVGAGTITCNYDGYVKSRTNIGDNAFIGSNTALVAPVTVGKGAMVGAGSVITAEVDADALAIARGQQVNKAGRAAAFRARQDAKREGLTDD
ncbi:MAG: bifunctional UDP-N-acetylglucosamine diphosphorylase/glucosamine-1-phosphate N-acetyltransferase GlmU [Pseudomonadota bacterium]